MAAHVAGLGKRDLRIPCPTGEIIRRYDGAGWIHCPAVTTLMGRKPEARWIWDAGKINPRSTYLHDRKDFHLKDLPVSAVSYVSAHAFAELYVNGVHVDRVPRSSTPIPMPSRTSPAGSTKRWSGSMPTE